MTGVMAASCRPVDRLPPAVAASGHRRAVHASRFAAVLTCRCRWRCASCGSTAVPVSSMALNLQRVPADRQCAACSAGAGRWATPEQRSSQRRGKLRVKGILVDRVDDPS